MEIKGRSKQVQGNDEVRDYLKRPYLLLPNRVATVANLVTCSDWFKFLPHGYAVRDCSSTDLHCHYLWPPASMRLRGVLKLRLPLLRQSLQPSFSLRIFDSLYSLSVLSIHTHPCIRMCCAYANHTRSTNICNREETEYELTSSAWIILPPLPVVAAVRATIAIWL